MTAKNGLLGEIWCIAGGRYSGKSTEGIRMTKAVPLDRLFVNEFHGSKWKDAGRNNRVWIPDEEFVEMCAVAKDSVFIFEDATAVFSGGKATKRFLYAMARSREEGVTIILMFHSFRKIPDDILDLIDGLVVFKTRDGEDDIRKKTDDPRVLEAYRQVKASPDPHAKKIVRFIHHHTVPPPKKKAA